MKKLVVRLRADSLFLPYRDLEMPLLPVLVRRTSFNQKWESTELRPFRGDGAGQNGVLGCRLCGERMQTPQGFDGCQTAST